MNICHSLPFSRPVTMARWIWPAPEAKVFPPVKASVSVGFSIHCRLSDRPRVPDSEDAVAAKNVLRHAMDLFRRSIAGDQQESVHVALKDPANDLVGAADLGEQGKQRLRLGPIDTKSKTAFADGQRRGQSSASGQIGEFNERENGFGIVQAFLKAGD